VKLKLQSRWKWHRKFIWWPTVIRLSYKKKEDERVLVWLANVERRWNVLYETRFMPFEFSAKRPVYGWEYRLNPRKA
jgi:hypothetical protein